MNIPFNHSQPLIYVGPATPLLRYGMTGHWRQQSLGFTLFVADGSFFPLRVRTTDLYSHRLAPTKHCPKPA